MVLKKVGVLSVGKVLGILYAAIGLIAGALITLASLLTTAAGLGGTGLEHTPFGALVGAGAIIALPIFYGIIGFIGGLICALIYNGVARVAGGLELDLE